MNRQIILPVIILGFCLSGSLPARAQYAPVTTAATVSTAVAGMPVNVPVTVTGFNNISSMTLYIDYDYTKVHYSSCQKNPLLGGSFSAGDVDLGNNVHRVIIGWYGLTPVTLPSGSWIIQYVFTYIGGSCALTWFDSGPSCKYTDGNGTVLTDTPASTYYINGLICGMIPAPGNITGLSQLCQGTQNVLYGIDPVNGATGYSWVVPSGASIISGNNTTSILVNYSDSAVSGNIAVYPFNDCGNGLLSLLAVTVGAVPMASAGNDTTIYYGTCATLHASGCPGNSCNYHWEPASLLVDPNIANPQTNGLTTTTMFSVVITTSGTICHDSDQVIVTVTGGPLTANPAGFPDLICESDTARLFANAGGGTGSYIYSWTCTPPGIPPWTSSEPNPLVNPSTSTTYYLNISDGISYAHGNVSIDVIPEPPAPFIEMEDEKLISDACCGNQWYLDDILIPGANGQEFLPEINGTYSDVVTLQGCSSDTSNKLEVIITKITHPMASSLQIIPNPAKDFFLLKCSGIYLKKIKLSFFSSDGILVKEVISYLGEDPHVQLIDVRDLLPGIYFINVRTNSQNLIQKLIII